MEVDLFTSEEMDAMAETASVCLSSDSSAPRGSSKASPGPSLPSLSGSILAGPGTILRPNISPRWHSMGDSGSESSSVSSAREDLPPQARDLETLGLAPKVYQLIDFGL